jgi:hypothetical protein
MMMLATGIPEVRLKPVFVFFYFSFFPHFSGPKHSYCYQLRCEEDLEWMTKAFALHLDPSAAEQHFKNLIQQALSSFTTQLNFTVHNIVHSDSKD